MTALVYIRVYILLACQTVTLALMSEPKPRFRHPAVQYSVFYIMMCLLWAAIASVCHVSWIDHLLLSVSIAAYMLFFLYMTDGPVLKNIYVFMAYTSYFMLATGWSRFLAISLYDGSVLAMSIIRSVFLLSYILLLLLGLRRSIIAFTDGVVAGWIPLCIFSVISCGIILFEVIYYYGTGLGLIQLVMMTVSLTSSFFVSFSMVMHLAREGHRQEIESRKDFLIRELANERELMESARRYRHDMRHHSAAVLGYLEDGDIEGARKYLEEFSSSVESYAPSRQWCENRAANAIIRVSARRCDDADISFTFDGSIPDRLPLSGPEIGCIFGNILENAIRAASGNPSGFVAIRSAEKGNSLFIEVRNTFDTPVCWNRGMPSSSRSGGGIGLRNVRSVLDRCGGMIHFSSSDGVFITQVVIPI